MIQRIQSIYLLIIALLFIQMFLFPLITFSGDSETITLHATHISTGELVLPITILFGLIVIISLITIFLFKKRILQIRLTIINIILMLGSIAMLGFYSWQIAQSGDYTTHYKMFCLFPLFGIILAYLAIRAIGKDEALVRSVDRIR